MAEVSQSTDFSSASLVHDDHVYEEFLTYLSERVGSLQGIKVRCCKMSQVASHVFIIVVINFY